MDMSKISMLMDKAAQDSKKRLNKEDVALFKEELRKVITEEGMTDQVIFYFVQGLRYGSVIAYSSFAEGKNLFFRR